MNDLYQNRASQPDSLHQVNQLLVEILQEPSHMLGIVMLVVMVMAQIMYLGTLYVPRGQGDKW